MKVFKNDMQDEHTRSLEDSIDDNVFQSLTSLSNRLSLMEDLGFGVWCYKDVKERCYVVLVEFNPWYRCPVRHDYSSVLTFKELSDNECSKETLQCKLKRIDNLLISKIEEAEDMIWKRRYS